jgi:tRNA U34 2-thiouridine synthase MnmA/TrmU
VQVRAHGLALPASITWPGDGEAWHVLLQSPLRALAAGQSAVLYRGDTVLAHGRVRR